MENADLYDSMPLTYFKNQCKTEDAKDLIDIFSGSVWFANPREMSTLFFLNYVQSCKGSMALAEAHGGAQQEKFVGGTIKVLNGFMDHLKQKGVRIEMDQEVVDISQSESVCIKTRKGDSFESEFVIMTIPPSRRAQIQFSPRLNVSQEKLIDRLYFGSGIKMILVYRKAFWREKDFSGEMLCSHSDFKTKPVMVCFDATSPDQDTPALVCFICGPSAYYWSSRSKEERKKAVTAQMSLHFGQECLDPVEYLEKDW